MTAAVRLPAVVGFAESVTLSEVAVAAVTAPIAPSLKTTVLLPAVVLKPNPLIVSVDALAARRSASLLESTTGVTVRHLDCGAAAHSIGRDDGGQAAGGRLGLVEIRSR